MLGLLVVSLIVGVLATGCVVHDKEKEVKVVKTTDSANR
jgi:hypothetical protein